MKTFMLFVLTLSSFTVEALAKSRSGIFSGRVSRINERAALLRIRIDFANMKYLNKKDLVEFWDERNPERKCKAYVLGKSNEHLLLKVPEFQVCQNSLFVTTGAYLKFFSQDLENNIKMGHELMDILIKKKLAVGGMLTEEQKRLDSHIERIAAINNRFKILRDKLELQWGHEINLLEEDRSVALRNYQALQLDMDEINKKMVQYRIDDNNLKQDRWALDPRLYYNK